MAPLAPLSQRIRPLLQHLISWESFFKKILKKFFRSPGHIKEDHNAFPVPTDASETTEDLVQGLHTFTFLLIQLTCFVLHLHFPWWLLNGFLCHPLKGSSQWAKFCNKKWDFKDQDQVINTFRSDRKRNWFELLFCTFWDGAGVCGCVSEGVSMMEWEEREF